MSVGSNKSGGGGKAKNPPKGSSAITPLEPLKGSTDTAGEWAAQDATSCDTISGVCGVSGGDMSDKIP
jgi:hypothetical protein